MGSPLRQNGYGANIDVEIDNLKTEVKSANFATLDALDRLTRLQKEIDMKTNMERIESQKAANDIIY